jgi:tetratricopeptide (TPR) repeat protein
LQRLSVFAGSWTLEAAEEVGGSEPLEPFEVLDLLSRLVDKSLVVVVNDNAAGGGVGAVRYRLLETVRQYARDRLQEAGETGATRQRHLAWFVALASAWRERSSTYSVDQLRELDPELDNLRAAIEFGLSGADPHAALQLVGDLHWFWLSSGLMYEGRRLAAWAITARPADTPPDTALVRALATRGSFEWRQGEYGLARETLTEAVALGRVVGDEYALEDALFTLTGPLRDLNELAEARRTLGEVLVLAERHGRQINICQCNFELGLISALEGKSDEAETRLALAERLGRQLQWARLNHVLRAFATLESARDKLDLACQYIAEALTLARVANERPGIAYALQDLGIARLMTDDPDGAERAFAEGLPLTRELGRQSGHIIILLGLAEVARRRGDAAAMAHQLTEAQGLLVSETWATRPGGVLADPVVRAHWISAVASLMALAGSQRSAARLLGAIAAHRPPAHARARPLQLTPRLWMEREAALAEALRQEIDAATFEAAFAERRALPLDNAMAEAGQLLAEAQGQA